MSCRDKSLYVPRGVGCGDCEITYDGIMEALGYSVSESTQTLPDGQGELDRLIIGRPLDRYPTSLTITTPPDKTDYEAGEFFDPTGMVVEIGYSDGSSEETTAYTITVAHPLMYFGPNTYTVSYTELGVTVTASSTVNVITTNTVMRKKGSVLTLIINESLKNVEDHEEQFGNVYYDYGSIYDIDATNQTRVAGGLSPTFPWRSDGAMYAFCDLPCEVKIFQHFFDSGSALITADLSSITLTGTSIEYMFSGCSALTSFTFKPNTELLIENAEAAFHDCISLPEFDMIMPNVQDVAAMFLNCTSLESIDMDLSNATHVGRYALEGCTALEHLSIGALGTAYDATGGNAYDLWLNTLTALPISEMHAIFQNLANVDPTSPDPQIIVSQTQSDAYTAEYTDFSIVTSKGWTVTIS